MSNTMSNTVKFIILIVVIILSVLGGYFTSIPEPNTDIQLIQEYKNGEVHPVILLIKKGEKKND